MVHVADIVNRNFATIQGLSLKGNRLRLLDFTSTLVFAAPHVVELDLSDNALTRIDELDRIRGWHIEKLHLENNELVSKFTEASSYARFLLSIFVYNLFAINLVKSKLFYTCCLIPHVVF